MEHRYSLESKKHGAGGFGKIIKGHDNILDRDVAVKILDPLLTTFPEERERFVREGRALASLSHPNIPAIYDIQINGEFKIIFEFISGENIQAKLQQGLISLAKAQSWITDVAKALKHSHSKGIIHRDVKPANLIITHDNQTCYLVDFGISLSKNESARITKDGYVIGTPGYMSPEQEHGDELDYRTDIYSLAICLYEMLAGNVVPKGHYDRLSDMNDMIPTAIDELILSCIQPKDARLSSLDKFVIDLSTALRPTQSISLLLTEGKLIDICNALKQETADSFIKWPVGQRNLLLTRFSDLIQNDHPSVNTAKTEMLTSLVSIGIYLPSEVYSEIVSNALEYGYSKIFSPVWTGNIGIRDSLSITALFIGPQNFNTLACNTISFVKRSNIEAWHRWQRHDLRDLLQKIMANTNCTSDEQADELSKLLRTVNDLQHKTEGQDEDARI